MAVTATAEGAALPVVGSPEQYLLRAKNVPPRPGEVAKGTATHIPVEVAQACQTLALLGSCLLMPL